MLKQLGTLGIFKYGGGKPTFFERVSGIQFGETLQKAQYKKIPEDIQIQIDIDKLKNEKTNIETDIKDLLQQKVIGEDRYNDLVSRVTKITEDNTFMLGNYYKKQAMMDKIISNLISDKIDAETKGDYQLIDNINRKIVNAGSEKQELQESVIFLNEYGKSMYNELGKLKTFIIKQGEQIKEIKKSSPMIKLDEQLKENDKLMENTIKDKDNIIKSTEEINQKYSNDLKIINENHSNEIIKINTDYKQLIDNLNDKLSIAEDEDKGKIQDKINGLNNEKDELINSKINTLKNSIDKINAEKENTNNIAIQAIENLNNKLKNLSNENKDMVNRLQDLKKMLESEQFTEEKTEEFKKNEELESLKKQYIRKFTKNKLMEVEEIWISKKKESYKEALGSVITKSTRNEEFSGDFFNIKTPGKSIKGKSNYVLRLLNPILFNNKEQYKTNFAKKILPYQKQETEIIVSLYDVNTPSKVKSLPKIKEELSNELINIPSIKVEQNEYLLNLLRSILKK